MDLLPLLPFLVFFVWLILLRAPRRYCPDCGTLLASFQSPFTKTKRQWIEGGFVCRRCGCESDLSGNKVAADSSQEPLIRGLALVALAAGPALAFLYALLQR